MPADICSQSGRAGGPPAFYAGGPEGAGQAGLVFYKMNKRGKINLQMFAGVV